MPVSYPYPAGFPQPSAPPPPDLQAYIEAVLGLASGAPVPGPVPGSVVSPQIAVGTNNVRDPNPTVPEDRGRVIVHSTTNSSGIETYTEHWVFRDPAITPGVGLCRINLVSSQPVDWATAREELRNDPAWDKSKTAALVFDYLTPPTASAIAALGAVAVPASVKHEGTFDVKVVPHGGAPYTAGRLFRESRVEGSTIFTDHWLLSPDYVTPSTATSVRIDTNGMGITTLAGLFTNPPPQGWTRYVIVSYVHEDI